MSYEFDLIKGFVRNLAHATEYFFEIVNVVPTTVHQDLIEYRRDRFYTCPKKRSFLISCRHIFAFVLRNIQSRSRDGQQ